MTTTSNPTTPDTDNTPSPLALWHEQVAALADPAQADQAIGSIYDDLIGLYNSLTAEGKTEQAQKAEQAYNLAVSLYESHQQHGVAVAGGNAAIEEIQLQRRKAVGELEDLVNAIKRGSETHPKLQQYAAEIRNDAEVWAAEAAYESAMEDTDENLVEEVMTEWHMSEERAYAVVTAVFGRYRNPAVTPAQRELFLAFANSFVIDDEDEAGESEDDDDSDE